MRKDSINSKALEQAHLIYKEHGLTTVDYDFGEGYPTDYARNTVQEPEHVSKLKESFNELTRQDVTAGAAFAATEKEMDALLKRIDDQQVKINNSRRIGNFQMFHRLMKEMNSMIKEKQRLDAKLATTSPAGNRNIGQLASQDEDKGGFSYAEMQEIGSKIAELEAVIEAFKGE